MIFLDTASTTPVKEEVIQVIVDVLRNNYGNPSSVYEYGVESKNIINESINTIKRIINADSKDKIIFTSGACESNSTVIKGFNWNYPIITTKIEHISSLQAMSDVGYDVDKNIVNVNNLGQIDLKDLNNKCKYNTLRENFRPVFSFIGANNEIGTIQPINKIQEIVHRNKGLIHVDATQYIPYEKIDVKNQNIDIMSFSGQKFGAPKGIGVLYIKDGIEIIPLICGNQQYGLRGGTENIAYIAGIAKAMELINYTKSKDIEYLRDYCWGELCKIADANNKKFKLNGDPLYRLVNNLNFQVPCLDSQQIVAIMDLNNICISAGSACNSYEKKPSHVLKAIGLTDEEANQSIRVTIGDDTTKEEIDEFVKQMNYILKEFC